MQWSQSLSFSIPPLEKLTNLYFATSHPSHMLADQAYRTNHPWIRHPSLAQWAMGTKIMWCKWYSLPSQQRLRAWLGIGSSGLQPEYVILPYSGEVKRNSLESSFIYLWEWRGLEPWQCKLDRKRYQIFSSEIDKTSWLTGGDSGRVSREKVWSLVWLPVSLLWLLSKSWYFPFPERESIRGRGG